MTVSALITTKDRETLLLDRSFPSVLAQTRRPDLLVIVSDGAPLSSTVREVLSHRAADAAVPCVLATNTRTPGYGGAVNSGLIHIKRAQMSGFVAILDDDDAWLPDHVEANLTASEGRNIVVSGLQMLRAGNIVERPLITEVGPRAFLTGNPGWQGSNTFVDIDLLLAAGGFREGLASLNDRDLAHRLLHHPEARLGFTGRWTAQWHADTRRNLSERGSPQKLDGLRAFYCIYRSVMSRCEERLFFARAEAMFGVSPSQILEVPIEDTTVLGFLLVGSGG